MERCVICHYGEIGLKGKNRRFFEKRLLLNIKNVLPDSKIYSPRGRVVIYTKEDNIKEKLEKIPGIAYFFFAEDVPSSIDDIKRSAVSVSSKKSFDSFRVTVKRADKNFPHSSYEVAGLIGGEIQKKTGKKVDLTNPDLTCFIEINADKTYIYFEKIKGVGGLPVGTGGKIISLLSGGIDSPVSSFRAIRRGVKNVFVHFHAYPTTSKESINKTKNIVEILSAYQGKSVLYLVPFNEIQKEILLNTKESLRVLLYRRFMMRIACEIAKKERAKALVTGESLGQVASQTIENMTVTEDVVDIPVFRPLFGYDKEEIVREAKHIGTYETSILPEEDCCIRFLPSNPETKGKVVDVKKEEEKLDTEKIINEALKNTEKEIIIFK